MLTKNILSGTELELIEMRIDGYTRKEIAGITHRSPLTIKTHFQNIHKKLGINEESEMIVWFIEEVRGISLKRKVCAFLAILLVIMIEVMDTYEALRVRNVKARVSRVATRARRSKSTYKLKYA